MATLMNQFREALMRLAAVPAEQRLYLEHLRTAPSADELGIELGDALLAVQSTLSPRASEAAQRLDAYLSSFSGGDRAALWDVSALDTAPEWRRVRELAEEALRELDE